MEWSLFFVFNSILLGVGLAMDAFSVSLANGLNESWMHKKKMCAIAGTFGFFQALMPMTGWVCVHTIIEYFKMFEKFIPWIALILLLFIGGKMVKEGIQDGAEEAEKAKKELSSCMTTNINLPFLAMAKDGPHHMDIQLSRSKFEELTKDLIERTVIPVENAIHDAGLTKSQIDMVLLVGGSTRIPAVQDKVRTLMGKEPSRNVNPDECVAIGAAVQAGKLGGQLMAGSAASEMILMDVTPLSLSIETVGGVSSRLIERNTTIPTRHSQIFTTAGNFQTSVDIKVFQGERKFTRDNKLLGNFRLSGIKRAMAGTPQIEVTFDIDANGIVNVSAKDLGTGHEQSITITSSSNLSEEEIERAKWEAQMYGRQDEAKTQLLAVRQEAVQFAGQAQAELDSHKKEWERSKKKAVKEILGKLKRTLYKVPPEKITADSAAVIRDLQEELQRALNS